uniref:Uncharacterized protein n=1 Tax=Polysiphonia sp. TaxID=1967842 RepID=A0A1Z1M4E0_9FLOR|nr:hypothetical protein [Polysiphonia sp.]
MIDKKNILLRKIDLLMISLEILNIYFSTNDNIIEFQEIRYDLKKCNFKTTYSFIKIVQYIYTIRLMIKRYLLHEIAIEILKKYTKLNKFNFITKYKKRFHNKSFILREYYRSKKLLNNTSKIDMNNTAFINLYIISKLINKEGVYILIKYLLN